MKGPLTVSLASANYVLRSLEPTDDGRDFCGWLEDPETAAQLNAAPSRLSLAEFDAYVRRFDRQHAHLLGIFRRDTGRLVGIWSIYIDWPRSRFIVNLLVGDKVERNRGVRLETADLVHRFFFEELGLLEEHCSAVESNTPIRHILESKGWRLTGREQKMAPDGVTPVGIVHYVLPRETWRRRGV